MAAGSYPLPPCQHVSVLRHTPTGLTFMAGGTSRIPFSSAVPACQCLAKTILRVAHPWQAASAGCHPPPARSATIMTRGRPLRDSWIHGTRLRQSVTLPSQVRIVIRQNQLLTVPHPWQAAAAECHPPQPGQHAPWDNTSFQGLHIHGTSRASGSSWASSSSARLGNQLVIQWQDTLRDLMARYSQAPESRTSMAGGSS